jgi:lysophospholipase L1-like esterase
MKIAFFGDSLTSGIPGVSYVNILHEQLKEHTLINLGRGNDTVVSLYRRVTHLHFEEPFDITFLWVGVNDVAEKSSWLFRAASVLRNQPRAKDIDEFRTYYQKTLALLQQHTKRQTVAVAPLLKGECITNAYNQKIEALANTIENLASRSTRVTYLDLRPALYPQLANRVPVDYLPPSPFHVGWDILTLNNAARADERSARRGLHSTIDGIHLNGTGARLVAEVFLQTIKQLENCPVPCIMTQ